MGEFRVLVKEDSLCKDILVSINGVDFNCDTIGNKTIMFWLTQDQADSVQFHIASALQELERKRENDTLKAGEELRDTSPLEKDAE
jgi:hypothetical protein